MNRFLLFLVLSCTSQAIYAQYVYTIKADSVKITNSCDTAELIIENHTQDVSGFLYNKGRGRTEFRRGLRDLHNNVFLIGADTLDFNKILDASYYKQGGNNFGATALLGTKDSFPLTFLQNGVEKGRIGTTGNWLFNTTEDKGHPVQIIGNIWHSGIIYQNRNINISAADGVWGDHTINIGHNNSISGNACIGLGDGVTVIGQGGVLSFGVGYHNTVVDGIGLFGSTNGGIAIGHISTAHNRSIALGTESVTTAEHQFVCGGPNYQHYSRQINDVYFGSGIQRNSQPGSGISYAINGSGAYGANFGGGNITIAGGKGTGTGTPGSIIFAIAQSTSSGSSLQDLSERARIDANGNFGIGNTTPSAMLHVSGTGRFDNTVATSGHRSAIRNTSGDTNIGDTDEYVFANAASGAITVTLPTATGRDGQTYTIKKTDNSSNAVNITNASSQLIDGMNSYSLMSQWAYVTVVANGGGWMIVAKN